MASNTPRRALGAAMSGVLLACVLAFAVACGGGDDDDSSGPRLPGGDQPQPAGATQPEPGDGGSDGGGEVDVDAAPGQVVFEVEGERFVLEIVGACVLPSGGNPSVSVFAEGEQGGRRYNFEFLGARTGTIWAVQAHLRVDGATAYLSRFSEDVTVGEGTALFRAPYLRQGEDAGEGVVHVNCP